MNSMFRHPNTVLRDKTFSSHMAFLKIVQKLKIQIFPQTMDLKRQLDAVLEREQCAQQRAQRAQAQLRMANEELDELRADGDRLEKRHKK
jgi:hypothetical protein